MFMKKFVTKVPYGIKYISEWEEYKLPEGHCIVDKGVTGCGYTEFCLTNEDNVILCSPRKLLLENKSEQHQNDPNIFYLRNDMENYSDVRGMSEKIKDHVTFCQGGFNPFKKDKVYPVKFLVTYDSAHYIIDTLKSMGIIDSFRIVVDEMQSLFLDSYFKANVEFDFVDYLQDCPNVIYLSATPMLDKYLEKVDEFKNLQFYMLDWSGTGVVENVVIKKKFTESLYTECQKVIFEFKSGVFPMLYIDKTVHLSKEAVFYFNSIGDITRVIKAMKLVPSEVNIICADTSDNRAKVKKISKDLKYEEEDFVIGKIPLKGEPNKMFTFCTKTAYIGADFYSDNASSYVFADPNIDCLALDISLDLPQIVGRQRDRNNPFKNNIVIFYRTTRKNEIVDRDAFDEKQEKRKDWTYHLLNLYEKANPEEKEAFLKKLRSDIQVSKYQDDFVSISRKTGLPVYNTFIEIANERAWDVSQKDYQDKITVTRALENVSSSLGEYKDMVEEAVSDFLDNHFYATGLFREKMRLYCEFMDKHKNDFCQELSDLIYYKIKDDRFRTYYNYYGTDGCRAKSYQENFLKEGLVNHTLDGKLRAYIYTRFKVGDRYTLKDIKFILGEIYRDLGIKRTPKASDLKLYFKLVKTRITLEDKTVKDGFRLDKLVG